MARAARNKPESGSREPIVVAFNSVRDELVSTLAYMLGSREDALDAAQEAFLKCWRAKATLPDVQNLRAWIFRVAMNAARDYQRSGWNKRSRPLVAEESTVTARDAAVADRMIDDEQVKALREALQNLREEERDIFLLRQNGDLTYEQIAEIRNVPVGTVKTQMRTALIKLRRALNPGADEPPSED